MELLGRSIFIPMIILTITLIIIVVTHYKKTMVTGGMGLALGWKYLSRNNWTGEIFSGVGRNFNYDYIESKIYICIGISIGKRF